jgi:ParB family chromosome partitioning protein
MDQEALQTLAHSIRSQGIIQPIVVRKTSTAHSYEIIAGERRWRAAQLAELEQIPAIIRDISDKSSAAFALIENIQRENLSALEEAHAFHRLIQEFDMTHQQVADFTGKSRPSISNLLRLLNIDPAVKILLENGSIEMGHARALLKLPNEQQLKIAKIITDKSLSVRATELMVQKIEKLDAPVASNKKPQSIDSPVSPYVSSFQELLKTKLNAPVAIKHTKKGKGRLIINYKNLAELEKIITFFS